MDYHGRPFLAVDQFRSRASDLNVKFLDERELEFYESKCLLLPVARTTEPSSHARALAQARYQTKVEHPEDLEPPSEWLLLTTRQPGEGHPFWREFGHNPYISKPDCATHQPWSSPEVEVTLADGRPIKVPVVERYYAYWQVHIVELLRSQRHYERDPFLRELPAGSYLHKWSGVPRDTATIRDLHGMATGYESLARFSDTYSSLVAAARSAVKDQDLLSEQAHQRLSVDLSARATEVLSVAALDEATLVKFVTALLQLLQDYRRQERASLADDVERDVWLTSTLAYFALGYEWPAFVDSVERHSASHWAAVLRHLDPIDAATEEAQQNLTYILNAGVGIAIDGSETADLPRELPPFCVTHELFEVLTGLEMYSFSEEDLQRDRYPWFLYRRLRPLALAAEHLARGILESAGLPHQGDHLSELYQTLGNGAPWVRELQMLLSRGFTSDKAGALEHQVTALKGSARPTDSEDLVIARTFALAVAARNLVSHRHRMVDEVPVRIMSGACARALVITWLLARRRGLV